MQGQKIIDANILTLRKVYAYDPITGMPIPQNYTLSMGANGQAGWITPPISYTGPIGDTGPTGSTGYTGSTGQTGSTGDTGLNVQITSRLGIGKEPDISYQLQLSTDAAAKPGTTSWTIASDIRIKKNVVDADIGLCYTNFKRMKLKYFEWRSNIYSDSEINDRRALGFIAQDVKEVFPKAVRIHPVYKIGSSEFTDFHTLNVDQIDKTHIGATQRLIQTVETQTDQITALTDTVAEQSRIIDTLQRQMRTMQMTLTQLQGLVAQIQSP